MYWDKKKNGSGGGVRIGRQLPFNDFIIILSLRGKRKNLGLRKPPSSTVTFLDFLANDLNAY